MRYQELLTKLRQETAPSLICLYGEEGFFRDRVLQQIIETTVPQAARDFNLTVLRGKEVRGQQLVEEFRTYPVFADRRLIIVKDAQLIPAAELEQLTIMLSDPVAESVVVFVADKIDKRKKFYQLLQKTGVLVEFKPLYDNQIPAFVRELLVEHQLRMTEAAMAAFCRRTGTNLQEIASEIEKLKSFAGDNSLIDAAEVELVVSKNHHQSVFDFTDALGYRKAGESLRILRQLLDEGEAPVGILSMMVRHFRQLWKIRDLLDQGISKQEIPKQVGVNPYFVNGLIQQSQNFSVVDYRALYQQFVTADLALKSSGSHPSAILEGVTLSAIGQ
jgi:DNA polymerase III subunit delta